MRSERGTIVVADDEPLCRDSLCELLKSEGYSPVAVADGAAALAYVEAHECPLVITDQNMPRLGGLGLLEAIEARGLATRVVLLTGHASLERAVQAMKAGAHDYLTKPLDPQRLLLMIPKAMEARRARRAVKEVRTPPDGIATRRNGITGTSTAIRDVLAFVQTVAASDASVLILGESGTGKELVARAIHDLGRRAAHPYVSVNSAALPATLLESELFGHERGAFTGAVIRKEGCFELSHHGTLFLDEVADTSLATQAKLLRVLEGHSYRRLGGTQDVTVDVRVISATNQNVDRLLEEGLLRPDLYYRLSAVVVRLPPLRERSEDIPLLAREFLAESNTKNTKNVEDFSPEAIDLLSRYPWPGNVREVRNAVEHAVILAPGATIMPEHLPAGLRTRRHPRQEAGFRSLDEMERLLIQEALARFRTKTRAAEVLGISLRTLYNKVSRYGLTAPNSPSAS